MTMPVVLSDRGVPEPPSDVQRRLQQVHPRLFLRWIDAVDTVWAICMRWDEHDPRYATIQEQIVDPERSFDIIGYLPKACQPDEAGPYLEKSFREFPRDDIQNLTGRVAQYNATAPIQQAADEALGDVLDRVDPSMALPKITRPKRR